MKKDNHSLFTSLKKSSRSNEPITDHKERKEALRPYKRLQCIYVQPI